MTFVIQVTGGVGVGVQASTEKLVTTIEKGEEAAEQLGAAMTKAGRASSTGMAAAANAAGRARDQLGRFVGSTKAATSSGQAMIGVFDGVARAIRREQDMLDQIHGPARRYAQDLETLNSLMRRGAITGREYTAQIGQMKAAYERSRGVGGGFMANLGGAGRLAAGAGVAFGLSEVAQAAVAYQNLQNRMRVVAGEGESVSATFDRIRESSLRTRSSLAETVGAYQRLKGATKEMGLGSSDLLRITERINKAIKVSGASGAEGAAGMQQLAQGLASGRLQGDELRSVLENLPYVADILAQSLGVTRGKLRELGEQGKLTSSVVINAFEKMGGKIDKDFGKTAPTLEEQWSTLRDTFMIVVGQIGTSLKVFETLGTALSAVGDVVGVVGDATQGLGDLFGHLAKMAGAEGAGGSIQKYAIGGLGPLIDLAGFAKDGLDAIADAMNESALASSRASEAYIAQVEAMRRLLAEEAKLERAASTLDRARVAGLAVPALDLETAKRSAALASTAKQMFGVDLPASYDAATKKALELDAAIAKIREKRALEEQTKQAREFERALSGTNEVLEAHGKRYADAAEKIKIYDDALRKAQEFRALVPNAPISRSDVEVVRGRRDALIELDATENRYGETIAAVRLKTLHQRDALEDAHGAYRTGGLTLKEYTDRLRELGVEEDRATKLLKELRQPALDWSATISALNALLRAGRIDLQQYNDELQKLAASQPTRTGELPRGAGFVGGRRVGGEEFAVGFEALSAEQQARATERGRTPGLAEMGIGTSIETGWMADFERQRADLQRTVSETKWLDDIAGKSETVAGMFERSALMTARWKQELELLQLQAQGDGFARGLERIRVEITDTAGALETTLVNAFHGAEQALIDFVTTGEFSFKKMVNSMLADLTRLLIRQAAAGILGGIAGGGTASVFGTGATQAFSGLFGGAPGFANGGQMAVKGKAGIDANLVAMRVTTGETITVTPPGQAPPAQGGAPAAVTVVNVYSDAEMDRYMEQNGEQHFVNFLRRNWPAIRGRTTGR